jgi:Ca2+:H+ antiporter
MNVSAVALILPTAICSTFKASELEVSDKVILAFSRGAAMVLFALYIYLFDQQDTRTVHGWEADNNDISQQESQQGIEQDTATPNNFLTSSTALVGSTAGVILCLHFLLASIDKTSEAIHVRRTFIATILIPIASNASKCATLIGTSQSSRADFALGVIVGSILQIALCIIPVLVMLGWVVHQPTTLKFDEFPTILLFLAILLVNRLVQNGKYTYIHGLVLVGLYVLFSDFVAKLDSH